MIIPFFNRLDQHMQEVASGASISMVFKLAGGGLTFALNVVLARILGVKGAGIFFLSLTMVSVASVIGRLGLGNALLRFTAARGSVNDWESVKGAFQKGMTLASTASVFLALIGFAASPWLAETLFSKPELAEPMRWFSPAVVPMTLLFLYSELLRGLKHIPGSQYVKMVIAPALCVPGVFILGRLWGVMGAIWAYNIAAFITAFTGYLLWRKSTPGLRKIQGRFHTRDLLHSCIPLFWVEITAMLIQWMSSLLLGIWGTNTDVGIFNIAFRTSLLTGLVLLSVNSIAAPKFAELFEQSDMITLATLAQKSTKLITSLTAPIFLVFFLMPHLVMKIFGNEFAAGAYVLMILACGQLINAATGSVGVILVMSGNERLNRNSVFFGAAICVALNLGLVPTLGLLGAAVATATGIAAKNISAAYLLYKRLNINTLPFDWVSLMHFKKHRVSAEQ